MPPIHPAIVHFPIALVIFSVAADFLGYLTGSQSLRAAGWWTLAGAVAGGAAAVAAGVIDMNREQIKHEAHVRVHTHMRVGFALLVALAGLSVWRWFIYRDAQNAVGWIYLLGALVVVALTFFQGYLGGELVFADGVGVAPTGQGTETMGEAQERVASVAGSAPSEGEGHGGH